MPKGLQPIDDQARSLLVTLVLVLGFTTRENSVPEIAAKIASAMLDPS